jgi:Protein of unknown function (DUF1045)
VTGSAGPRYAIYAAPPPGDPLWRFGSQVLGYDAETGHDLTGFELPSISAPQWRASSARARAYGFHATLKAPFRLAAGIHETELVIALEDFAAAFPAPKPVPLVTAALDPGPQGAFIALVPEQSSTVFAELEAVVVKAFEPFRAALTQAEIDRRIPAMLTKRQRRLLAGYGYPFVLDEFRAHFTLSDRLPDATLLLPQIDHALTAAVGTPVLALNHLALFKQESPADRFRVFARAPFAGTP